MDLFNKSNTVALGVAVLALFATISVQTAYAQSSQLWSDVFGNADVNTIVHIREGQIIFIDQDIDVGGIIIEGELHAQDTGNLSVSTEWALVVNGGLFQVGSSSDPFEHNFTLTLTGDNTGRDLDLRSQIGMQINNNDAFLMAMGNNSRIRLFGVDAQKQSWTQVSRTVEAGTQVLFVADRTGWEVGDKIAIASSSYNFRQAEDLTIESISDVSDGQRIVVEETIQHRHYGEVEQYSNGSLSWNIDMRAEVGLLSRNVTITGDENAHVDRTGGHLMVSNSASLQISGSEFTRMGQFGVLGRYAAHWHLLGDKGSGQFIQNSSFHHTFNKGFVVHGTHNTLIDNNVVYDTLGHGIFLEDGNETGNIIKDNLVFSTRRAPAGATIPTDITHPTSFWIEHPNNILTGNHAAGSHHAAFWIFGPDAPHGDSTGQIPPGGFGDMVFENNTAHSSRQGVFVDGFIRENLTIQGGPVRPANEQRLLIRNTTAYQIRNLNQGAIWTRVQNAVIHNAMVADSTEGVFMWQDDVMANSIVVSESMGNSEPWQDGIRQKGARMYFVGTSALRNSHFVGFDEYNEDILKRDVAISVRGTADTQVAHIRGVTFADTPEARKFLISKPNGREPTRILDHDGSLTGTAGTLLRISNSSGATSIPAWQAFATTGHDVPRWSDVLDELLGFR